MQMKGNLSVLSWLVHKTGLKHPMVLHEHMQLLPANHAHNQKTGAGETPWESTQTLQKKEVLPGKIKDVNDLQLTATKIIEAKSNVAGLWERWLMM